jgi:hypothetical protein
VRHTTLGVLALVSLGSAVASCSLIVDVGDLVREDGGDADTDGDGHPVDGEGAVDADVQPDGVDGDGGADADADIEDAADGEDAPTLDVVPPCTNPECSTICAEAGFTRGICMASGFDCYCTEPTYCSGPFRGSNVYGRWVAYNIGTELGAVCTVSTCDEFTGDTYLMISSGWNGDNDNACGLGSELVAGPMTGCCVLTIWVKCLSPECSWAITADCTPACTVGT